MIIAGAKTNAKASDKRCEQNKTEIASTARTCKHNVIVFMPINSFQQRAVISFKKYSYIS